LSSEIIFLGGAGELGANSVYIYLDGTGIIIDAGLHPRKRDRDAFPSYECIIDKPVDILLLTHAHTDHIGAIPYLLKFFPHVKMLMTKATRDLTEIMLKDTAKLLKSEIADEYSSDTLSLYQPEILERIWMLADGVNYREETIFKGYGGRSNVKIVFYPSGHILGSASVLLECSGNSILHSGDIQFNDQAIISKAEIPRRHYDNLILECTNAANDKLPYYEDEKKRLASFINNIVNENGSILIPSFALGKTQEGLKIIYSLMRNNSIPTLPIYSGGLGKIISRVYDRYCYSVPFVQPGFEVSDIPQEEIIRDEILTGRYFKEPSIVIASSGMVNKGTTSYILAREWLHRRNYGIAFVGYQDKSSNGYELLNSKDGEEFNFGTDKLIRACSVDSFRFTSHARLEDLIGFAVDSKPKQLFINHGEPEAIEYLALQLSNRLEGCNIYIPEIKKQYKLL
jgi:cleavage and polyadenylation specificity factor subunit 3